MGDDVAVRSQTLASVHRKYPLPVAILKRGDPEIRVIHYWMALLLRVRKER
jgi:hypothetical protein